MNTQPEPCWCGNTDRSQCCEPILNGQPAPTAEALMRSRYSAYVTGNSAYLLHSWHPTTRPASIDMQARQRWLGLKIRSVQAGAATDETGTVEFVARFKIDGRGHRLHEHSNFSRHQGRWVYVDGRLVE